ncbi:hypothetical protein D3869_28285 (plasmid) [Azospirillum brasilense]|uniref:Uncharacterized protein n=1 Tax=Azospirillum brasilense TaxID=192 RepID=A0A4D8RFB5_AZOBR|nr:hypothetical protein D3869_28285 [Azospirillum brasilense]
MGADEVGVSVMASIASTCILVCHYEQRLTRGSGGECADESGSRSIMVGLADFPLNGIKRAFL